MIAQDKLETIITGFSKLKNIAVLGDVGVDKYTSGLVERISPEAPVPVVEVNKEWMKLGLAANVSDNLVDLGVSSTLCGVIGNDSHGEVFEELLENRGLSTWGLVHSKSRSTTFKERIVADAQQICRIDYESKDPVDETSKNFLLDRLNEFSNDIDGIILEDYGKGLFDEKFVQEVIALAKKNGKLVTADPSRKNPGIWYRGSSLLKPNLKEANILMKQLGYHDEVNKEKMCEILLDKLDLENIVITLGAEGMISLAKGDGKTTHIPTMARDVFDVSGAGDTSIAVLTASLISGGTLEDSAWVANLAAGVVVAKNGTATATISEVRDYYAKINTTR